VKATFSRGVHDLKLVPEADVDKERLVIENVRQIKDFRDWF